jgi:hypothetical protein
MSEIVTGQDGAATEAALAEEGAKVEAARAELYDETAGQQGQPDGGHRRLHADAWNTEVRCPEQRAAAAHSK